MRTSVSFLSALLCLIAMAGIGVAVAMVVHAVDGPHPDGFDILAALAVGAIPFLIGTVALAGLATTVAIDQSREARRLEVAHLAALLKQHQPPPSADTADPGSRGQRRPGQGA